MEPGQEENARANPAPETVRRNHSTLFYTLFLSAVTFALYAPTLWNGFVADDEEEVLADRLIRSFANIPGMFAHNVWFFRAAKLGNYYRPLKLLAYSIEYHLFGFRPALWHLVNVLCNLAVVLAIYFLVRDSASRQEVTNRAGLALRQAQGHPGAEAGMKAGATLAFWTALFFAFHPIHAEAVAWIAAGNDLQCGLMLLLALWLYHRARLPDGQARLPSGVESAGLKPGATSDWLSHRAGTRSILLYGGSVLLFFAGLLLKETALVLPAAILAYDFLYRGESVREMLRAAGRYVPYLAALALYLGLRIYALGGFAPGRNTLQITPKDTLLSIPVLVAKYFWKAIAPFPLRYWYGFEPVRSIGWQPIAAAIFLLALVLAILRLRRTEPLLSFGVAWFVLFLIPVLDISRIGKNIFAERYLYIPSFGFCIFAAWAWLWLRNRGADAADAARPRPAAAAGRALPQRAAYAGLLALFAFYSFVVVRRLSDWHDNLRFWTKTAQQSPNSAVALAGAAYADFEQSRFQEGIRYAERAVALDPGLAPVHSNLGMAYLSLGRYGDALREVQEAVELQPNDPELWSDLATVYRAGKEWQRAIAACYRGLALDMKSHDLLINLGVALWQSGQRNQAIIAYRRAIAAEPENLDAYIDLAGALAETGQPDEAISELRQALAANPRSPQVYLAHFELGLIYDSRVQWQDAAREYQQALDLQPGFTPAREKLKALRPVLTPPKP